MFTRFSNVLISVIIKTNLKMTERADKLKLSEPIVMERIYNAPISRVWKAITNKEEMKQWYFDLAEFKPEVGFEFEFNGGTDKKVYRHLCKITEVVPQKKLSHTWKYDGYDGNSLLTFELFEEGGNKTRLKLMHEGLHTFPGNNPDFAKENFAEGWTMILDSSLKDFLEKI
jgi:uncharacterized protein YndB with AHSA1/START domain